MNDGLTESNFILYAAKHYDNPQCIDTEEFYDDLKRFAYIKRLFGKYKESGELKERLILNHIIVLYNLFGPATTQMLFFKIDNGHYKYLKPFLILLGYMPNSLVINDQIINTNDIPLDVDIVNALRKI